MAHRGGRLEWGERCHVGSGGTGWRVAGGSATWSCTPSAMHPRGQSTALQKRGCTSTPACYSLPDMPVAAQHSSPAQLATQGSALGLLPSAPTEPPTQTAHPGAHRGARLPAKRALPRWQQRGAGLEVPSGQPALSAGRRRGSPTTHGPCPWPPAQQPLAWACTPGRSRDTSTGVSSQPGGEGRVSGAVAEAFHTITPAMPASLHARSA